LVRCGMQVGRAIHQRAIKIENDCLHKAASNDGRRRGRSIGSKTGVHWTRTATISAPQGEPPHATEVRGIRRR
jgi:hypothetical protein